MRKILNGIFAVLLALCLQGCTQADGYIGDWFGSWHLEEVAIDGEPNESYDGSLIISFQGNLVKMTVIDRGDVFGTWEEAGETLTLNLSYGAGNAVHATWLFNPFPVMLLLPEGVDIIEMDVVTLKSKTMEWQYIDPDGRLLTYSFKKYP